jgi:hypothetical protein
MARVMEVGESSIGAEIKRTDDGKICNMVRSTTRSLAVSIGR